MNKTTDGKIYQEISLHIEEFERNIEKANERIGQVESQIRKLDKADEEFNNYLGEV
jgi:hypothetical protein